MSESTLISNFLQAINDLSYYNAAEGASYWSETQGRNRAEARLLELKKEMVAQYGREETRRIANSQPHLVYSELSDLAD